MTRLHITANIIGLPAFAWLWYLTDWKIALAIFLVMFANNLSQTRETT